LRAKGCSNDAWMAWARPRRKRNVDGEVLPMAIACPETDNDLMILSDPIETRGCVSLKDHP
jgi:hypothetical protein